METIVALIGGCLLGIPVIAIIALVRSGNTRRMLDELSQDYREKLGDLNGEIASLHRELNEVSQRADRAIAASSPALPTVAEASIHEYQSCVNCAARARSAWWLP